MIQHLDGNFLHCIDLNNPIVSHNWSLPSFLSSVSVTNKLAFNLTIPLYTCNPDDLYLNPERCLGGGLGSPGYINVMVAAILRQGQILLNGYGEQVPVSPEDREQLLFKSELEIELEKVRQEQFGYKPSRLASIFLVEDSQDGRDCLSHMFYEAARSGKYSPHIISVRVAFYVHVHRGDVQWLDKWAGEKDRKLLEAYWSGSAMTKSPKYEYFLEGTIYPTNKSQIEWIREHGAKFPGYDASRYWRDLDCAELQPWFAHNTNLTHS